MVVITDGESTYDSELTLPYAEEARNQGIVILSIGVSSSINVDEVKKMSSSPQST